MSTQSTSETAPPQVEYRDVPGFPGYRAGRDGTIWSKRLSGGRMAKQWKLLTGGLDKYGYRKTILFRGDGTCRHCRWHTVVLEAFIGPCPPGLVGCHNDGDKLNNRADNLRWDTQKNNLKDRDRHGTDQRGDRGTNRVLNSKQVAEIRRRRAAGERNVDLAREFGVDEATISAIWVGRNWKQVCESTEAA